MATSEDWSGRMGLEWARRADDLDRMMAPAGAPALAALGDVAGCRVLDLGCGAGATSRAIAALGAQVTGLDISEDLLKVARSRAPDLTFVAQDASTYVAPTAFDVLHSRFGMMFFDDPPAALRHIRGQMVPGGRAVLMCWRKLDENPWATEPARVIEQVIGPSEAAPNTGPGPFAWGDGDFVRTLLEGAGWRDVRLTRQDHMLTYSMGDAPTPEARAVTFFTRIGPIARRLRDLEE
ncbi:MAG: class I SAM-dependent methyltransferase, partial [Pseudomonadota bacterium]